MKTKSLGILLIFLIAIGYAFSNSHSQAQTATKDSTMDSTKVELQNEVTAILKVNCSVAGCHRGSHPKKKLNLETDKFLKSVLDVKSQEIDTLKRVDTKNPEKSYLLMKVKGEKGIRGSRMPDDAPPLKKEQIKAIEDWIFSLKEPVAEKEKTSPPKEDKEKTKK
jgi:hypothetical protein